MRWRVWLWWTQRGRRMVRLHMAEMAGVPFSTIEGVMTGRRDGHYMLELPKLLKGEKEGMPLEGTALVPEHRVIFVQVLGGAQ